MNYRFAEYFDAVGWNSLIVGMRSRVGGLTRAISTRIGNPELRRVLNPYEVLFGPDSMITMGAHSYFKSPPRVHHYEPDDGRVGAISAANRDSHLAMLREHLDLAEYSGPRLLAVRPEP